MKLCDLGHPLLPSPDLVVHHMGSTDQAIAACGSHAHEAVKMSANEFLESEVCELMQACVARLSGAVAAQQNARDQPGHGDVEVAANQYRATTGPPKR